MKFQTEIIPNERGWGTDFKNRLEQFLRNYVDFVTFAIYQS